MISPLCWLVFVVVPSNSPLGWFLGLHVSLRVILRLIVLCELVRGRAQILEKLCHMQRTWAQVSDQLTKLEAHKKDRFRRAKSLLREATKSVGPPQFQDTTGDFVWVTSHGHRSCAAMILPRESSSTGRCPYVFIGSDFALLPGCMTIPTSKQLGVVVVGSV